MSAIFYIRFLCTLYLLHFVHGSSNHDKHFDQRCVQGLVHSIETIFNSTEWSHLTDILDNRLSTIGKENYDGVFTSPSSYLQDESISFKISDRTGKSLKSMTKDMSDLKQTSSVSELYSLSTKVSLDVNFQYDVTGSAHMRVYTSTCTVGEHVAHGMGSSKSVAKNQAAAAALKKIKSNLTDLSKSRKVEKTRKSIKFSPEKDPIQYLHEWSMHSVRYEEGDHTKESFVYHCFLDGVQTCGFGRSKKIAKKAAALEMMGLLKSTGELDVYHDTNLQVEKQTRDRIETDVNEAQEHIDVEMNLSKPNSFENERQLDDNLEDLLQSIGKDMGYDVDFRSKVYGNVHVSFVSISSGSSVTCYGVGVDEKQSRQETSRAAIEYLLSLIDIENIHVGKKENSIYKNYYTSQMASFFQHQ